MSVEELNFGIYETMRTFNGELKFLDRHLKRMEDGAKFLGIYIDGGMEKVEREVKAQASKNFAGTDLRIRFSLARGELTVGSNLQESAKLVVNISELSGLFLEPISLVSYRGKRPLPQLKSESMSLEIAARKYASDRGYDEAIFFEGNAFEGSVFEGRAFEGSKTNIFFIKDGQIFTNENGILLGITRQIVCEIADVKIVDFSLNDLYNADEIFVTNSVQGIVPVKKIDKKLFENISFEITNLIKSKYEKLANNGDL